MERNDDNGTRVRPRNWAGRAVLAAGLLALLMPSALSGATAYENRLVAEINRARLAQGRKPLSMSAGLARAARTHARDMARRGYFSHVSRDGTSFRERVGRSYRGECSPPCRIGENIIWMPAGAGPREPVRGWLASRSHRQILLSAAWKDLGVGAVLVRDAPGVFHGRDVIVVVADFGSP